MSQPTEVERRIEAQFGLKRSLLLLVGVGCMVLGVTAIALPAALIKSVVEIVGVISIGSGALKAVQLLLGRRSAETRRRSWGFILLQVGIDVGIGLLLINYRYASLKVVAVLLGLLCIVEGLVLLYMSLRAPSRMSCFSLLISGLAAVAIGIAELSGILVDPMAWVGWIVGIKLIFFGGALFWIALLTSKNKDAIMYEAAELVPEVAELYAVYFGTAFHLGVYIGNNEIVHYLNDNHVYRVSWEKFLEGRSPEHWTYPDLPPTPAEEVVRVALSEVGKTYPYHLLRFNCENFAVFCKSGGRTYQSIYAQVTGGMSNVKRHPILGTVAELNTRLVEWVAFNIGGSRGKQLSLVIRRLGAALTNFLVNPAGQTQPSRPE